MKTKSHRTDIFKHLMLTLPLALTLSGCSTVSYVEPTSGPTARVRFVTDTDQITIVRSYSSTNCDNESEMMRLRNGFLLVGEPRRLGIPLWNYHNNAGKEFLVNSNKPHVYMIEGSEQSYRQIRKCGTAIKQKFEEGKDYEISYKWNFSNCRVEVSEIKKDELGEFKKVILQERNNKLTPEFSKSCLSEFKKLRLY